MGFMNMLGGLLQRYGSQQSTPDESEHDAQADFGRVAGAVPSNVVGEGIAEAFRSKETPPFSQMVSQLFGSGGGHQASLLNTLLTSGGPALIQKFLGQNPGSALSRMLGGGSASLTNADAAAVPQEEVDALAAHVEQHDPSVVDRIGQLYAEHPTAFQTLGAAAAIIALRSIARRVPS